MNSISDFQLIYDDKKYAFDDLLFSPNNKLESLNIIIEDVKNSTEVNYSLSLSTSGTTSKPKTIKFNKTQVDLHCQSIGQALSLDQKSVWLNCLPLNHIAGRMIIYRSLFYASSLIFHDCFDVQKIWDDCHHYKVTHLSVVPIMLKRLLDYQLDLKNLGQNDALPESLQFILVGGDSLDDSLFQQAKSKSWPILISYGMTEACSTVALGESSQQLKLLPGIKAKINSKGILSLSGKIFALLDDNDWIESGDRASIKDGYITIKGRSDQLIISGGKNISPEKVYQLTNVCPLIEELVISKKKEANWGDTIVAVVVLNKTADLNDVKKWMKEEVLSEYRPRIFITLKQIPRNQLGKVDYAKIKQLVSSGKCR